jgi:integrase
MARSVRSNTLENRSNRLKLPVARKPAFVKIGAGVSLGYRRNETAGTWVMRVADGKGGNWTKAIGHADDFAEASEVVSDGDDILTYWQAQARAQKLAKAGHNDGHKLLTVGEAIDRYEADLRLRSGETRNARTARKRLPAAMANKPVALLTVKELSDWRNGLSPELMPSSINRVTNALKAALNLAAKEDERITNTNAWRIGLALLPNATNSRNVILSDDEVRRIVEAARAIEREWGLFVEVAALTGARPGQMRDLRVDDLLSDPPRLLMPASRKGRGEKQVKHRPLAVTESLADRLATDRAPTAPLLVKPNGKPWAPRDHSQRFQCTAKRAGLDPKVVTLYALRHSAVVRMIIKGVPLRVIAANLDTSVIMLERTYSRYISEYTDALARGALLAV